MESRLSIVEHLEELRSRLIKAAASVIIMSAAAYIFVDEILAVIVKPVGHLVFIAPQEAFVSRLKLCIFLGLFLSAPLVLYQIWKFISSALKRNEKRYVMIFAPLSYIFFLSGSVFGYFTIIPVGIKFLLSFASETIIPMITFSQYISFVGVIVIASGAIFDFPIASLFLTKIGLISSETLSEKRKHAIVIIFIFAAFITPPDVITQILLALPLMVLYEVSILFSRFAERFGGR
ncbi:MAG: twin-arginine translocase subunit TatC [Candidatus Omnitrophica bacterium]|nr:twin-arginine translocase subunit TatC [Candidatus Omnitrophota bacterium]